MNGAASGDVTPIGDYALLSDCHATALVSRAGSVDWWCPPRADHPSVFGRLLDPAAGHWLLHPEGPVEVRRQYLPGTLVLETTVTTADGEVRLRDALSLDPSARGHDIGLTSPQLLVRAVEGLRGRVRIRCELRPRMEYGLTTPNVRRRTDGSVALHGGALALRLVTPVPLDVADGAVTGELVVEEGDAHTFALACAARYGSTPPTQLRPDEALAGTVAAWESWSASHTPYQGPFAEIVRRSALVLQGLTYQPSGAVLAAATASLPAQLGGNENWDYRYAWLRDLSLTAQALWVAACPDEADRFLRFVADAAGHASTGERVQIMYGVDGRRRLPEHGLGHLSGYAGSTPVRVGNGAWSQSQLDVMGEVLDMALRYRDQLDPLDASTRRLLVWMAEEAASTWQSPDAGMWEARDRRRQYTSSKVMCWVALDRATRLADVLDADDKADRWHAVADEIRRTVLAEAWNDDVGAYVGAFGSDRLDASVLLMPLIGFLDADDSRMLQTIRAVQQHLVRDGLVYRWNGDANGFVLCTAWLVECLALAGRHDEATALFEDLVARGGDLGLFAEQIAPDGGGQRGNYPQAFSHVGLINAAWRLKHTGPQPMRRA